MKPASEERPGSLVRHSLVYGMVPFLRYGVSIGMTAFYTAKLHTSGYGVKEVLDLWILLAQQLLGLNVLGGMLRIYFDRKSEQDRALVISSSILLLSALAWSLCGWSLAFSDQLAPLLLGSGSAEFPRSDLELVLKLTLILIPFQLSTLAGLYYLQILRRSALYAGVQLAKLALEVALHLIFLGILGWGLRGFLLGLLIGEAATTLLLTGWILVRIGPRVSWSAFSPVLSYAAPLVPVGLFQLGLHQADRRLLEHVFTGTKGLDLVGIYGLGYKVSYLVNAMVLGPFLQVFQPYVFALRDPAERARTVSLVSTWALATVASATLVVVLFGRQAVELLSGSPAFDGAWRVIPWVASGYVFWALYNTAVIPLYLDKRTKPVALINALALVTNIGLNLLLIPRFEIVGAAAATLISFALLAVLGMLASRSAAGVRFELGRQAAILSIVLGAAAAAYVIDARAVSSDAPAALGLKAAILVLLLGVGWTLLLRSGERAALGAWLRARIGRGPA